MNKMLTSLYKSIMNTVEREHLTPDNEILIPIPKVQVDEKKPEVVEFIKTVGKIDRNNKLPINVKIEPKRTKYMDKEYETINFIFKFDTNMDTETLKEMLGVEE